MKNEILKQLKIRVQRELEENIIPFWVNRSIDTAGGFIGRMTNDGIIVEKAPKGLILNTRTCPVHSWRLKKAMATPA